MLSGSTADTSRNRGITSAACHGAINSKLFTLTSQSAGEAGKCGECILFRYLCVMLNMAIDVKKMTHVEVAQLWEQRSEIFKSSEIDLRDNQEIDSSGIAFLVQWAKSNGNRLTVYNASENVKSLIKTFKLSPLFVIAER